jgi:hypothetical protein
MAAQESYSGSPPAEAKRAGFRKWKRTVIMFGIGLTAAFAVASLLMNAVDQVREAAERAR